MTGFANLGANDESALTTLKFRRTETILNDLSVAILAGICVFLCISVMRANDRFERYKERIALVAEVDQHLRQALSQIAESALTEDMGERLRRIDDAVEQFDDVVLKLNTASPRSY
jgi:hypothetical protein